MPSVLLVKTLDLRLKKTAPAFSGFEGGMVTSTTPLLVSADAVLPAVSPPVVEVAAEDAATCKQAGGHHGSGQSACEQLLLFCVSPLLLCFLFFFHTVRFLR
ncbi:MAG: hypothetical protein ACLT0Z_11065 [Gemmiger sp.]